MSFVFPHFDGPIFTFCWPSICEMYGFSWADIATAAAALYTWQWLVWWLFIWRIVDLVLFSFLKSKVRMQFACFFLLKNVHPLKYQIFLILTFSYSKSRNLVFDLPLRWSFNTTLVYSLSWIDICWFFGLALILEMLEMFFYWNPELLQLSDHSMSWLLDVEHSMWYVYTFAHLRFGTTRERDSTFEGRAHRDSSQKLPFFL